MTIRLLAALERLLSTPRQTRQTDHDCAGPGLLRASDYLCPHCHQGHSPRDRELDVEGVACSPGVRRMMVEALVKILRESPPVNADRQSVEITSIASGWPTRSC